MHLGRVWPISKKIIIKKIYCSIFVISPLFFIYVLFNFGMFFLSFQKYKSGIKIPDFRQNFQKLKKNWKKEKKMFLCIWPSVSKLKNHIVFFIQKKQYFSMHFGFNNQFIKIKRTLTKISKTKKKLFFLSFSIRGTPLHVIYILNFKFCFFQT